MEEIARRFEETHPGIAVDVQLIPWNQYWTKLEASAMSDTMPDVFWMHSQSFLRYASNGMLLDLTDLEGFDTSAYPEDLVQFYTYEGKRYAIPKDFDTIGLWYNKRLFDEKGIPYPDETWDWQKLVTVAQQLTDPARGIYGFLAPLDQQSFYYDLVYQNGGEILNADKTACGYRDPITQEAIQFAVDMSQKYHVSPTIQQFADMSREQYFQSGKAAMAFFGSWMLGDFSKNEYVAQNCDVAMLPKGKRRWPLRHMDWIGTPDRLMALLPDKICIGQGFRGKTGASGIGLCTSGFDFSVPGCPPTEDRIYRSLKEYILTHEDRPS